ncbi:BgTH12-06867 [Blumeria graminis f. sp. triticale]|uniref:BgTH12-06867 n=1 Tax=Blumeria graminis f. sp. triticale TaxID=1689686 RepID=A0A9W4DDQ2_BLUGR|nr:BgTH12-06867 [Blumeria graminis f. sp. triticale]
MGTSPRIASVASRAIWGDFESEGETNVEPTSEPVVQKSNLELDESSNLGNNGTLHGLSSNELNEDASQIRSAAKSDIVRTEGCHNPVSDLSNATSAKVSTEPVNSFGLITTDALSLSAISNSSSQNDPQYSCEHELSSVKSPPTPSELHEVGLCEDKESINGLKSDKLVTKQETVAAIENKISEKIENHTEKLVNQTNLEETTQEKTKDEKFSKDLPADENSTTKTNPSRDDVTEKNHIEAASKNDKISQDAIESRSNVNNLENMEISIEDSPVKNRIVRDNYSAENLSGDNNVSQAPSEKNSVETTNTDKEELSVTTPKNNYNIKNELTTEKSVINTTMEDRKDKQKPYREDAFEGLSVVKDVHMKEKTAKSNVIADSTLEDASQIISIKGTLFKDPFAANNRSSPGDFAENQHPVGDDSRDHIPKIEDARTENISKNATSEVVTQFSSAEQLQTVEADLNSECKRLEESLTSDSMSELKSADENTLPPSNFSSAPQTLNDEKVRGEESSERNSGKADRSNFEAASPRTNTGNNPKRTDSKGADSMFYLDTHFFIRIMARCANLRPSGMTRQKGNPQQTSTKALDLSETTPPRGKHRTSRSGSSTPDKWKRSLREKIKDKIGDRLHKYKE